MSVPVAVRGVSHRYAPNSPAAIDDLSLTVPAGEILTVLGPSGSGKSTLLALIAGIETPTAGDICFGVESILAVPPAKRGMALVLQQPHLFPYLSVGDNVAFGLAARGVRRARRVAEARRWLAAVGLEGMAERRPRQLSGGEQQRVALVRALAVEPRVLLLDEPLASLDPQVRGALATLLRELIDETGVTTLMVTHDLSEAMALGDRTALLHTGRLIAEGVSRDLYRRPPNRAAAEFMGVSVFLTGEAADGHIRTAAGPLRIDAHGDRLGLVEVAIRPEHVRLVATDGPNVIRGTVRAATYRGEHWDHDVDTPLGTLGARSDDPVAAGGSCHVALPATHLFILEPSRTPPATGVGDRA